jgi:hypothetical protein
MVVVFLPVGVLATRRDMRGQVIEPERLVKPVARDTVEAA